MNPTPTKCPVCGGDLLVTRLHCPSCETTLEGSFVAGTGGRLQEAFSADQLRSLLPFARLNQEQLYFILTFVRCEGRFNRMEEELGLSYPTLRTRLDEVIRTLGFEPAREEAARGEDAARREDAARAADAARPNVPPQIPMPAPPDAAARHSILDQLNRGEINLEEAKRRLRGERPLPMEAPVPPEPRVPSEIRVPPEPLMPGEPPAPPMQTGPVGPGPDEMPPTE